MANLIALVRDVRNELDFLYSKCAENNGECESKEPDFITLYISMVSSTLITEKLIEPCFHENLSRRFSDLNFARSWKEQLKTS
jgi:hypothetical protein